MCVKLAAQKVDIKLFNIKVHLYKNLFSFFHLQGSF